MDKLTDMQRFVLEVKKMRRKIKMRSLREHRKNSKKNRVRNFDTKLITEGKGC